MDTFMCSSWYHACHPYHKAGERLSGRYAVGCADGRLLAAGGSVYRWANTPPCTCCTALLHEGATGYGYRIVRRADARLFNQGIILGPDGNRMSKSKDGVIAPDDLVEQYGADTVRAYLMFIGPWGAGGRGIRAASAACAVPGRVGHRDRAAAAVLADRRTVDRLSRERHVTHRTLRKVAEESPRTSGTRCLAAADGVQQLPDGSATPQSGTPAWDEAIDLLLLMRRQRRPICGRTVAAAAWRGCVRPRAEHPSSPGRPTSRRWPRPPHAGRAGQRQGADSWAARGRGWAAAGLRWQARLQKWLEGKQVRKVIYAGGKLINIVVQIRRLQIDRLGGNRRCVTCHLQSVNRNGGIMREIIHTTRRRMSARTTRPCAGNFVFASGQLGAGPRRPAGRGRRGAGATGARQPPGRPGGCGRPLPTLSRRPSF